MKLVLAFLLIFFHVDLGFCGHSKVIESDFKVFLIFDTTLEEQGSFRKTKNISQFLSQSLEKEMNLNIQVKQINTPQHLEEAKEGDLVLYFAANESVVGRDYLEHDLFDGCSIPKFFKMNYFLSKEKFLRPFFQKLGDMKRVLDERKASFIPMIGFWDISTLRISNNSNFCRSLSFLRRNLNITQEEIQIIASENGISFPSTYQFVKSKVLANGNQSYKQMIADDMVVLVAPYIK